MITLWQSPQPGLNLSCPMKVSASQYKHLSHFIGSNIEPTLFKVSETFLCSIVTDFTLAD
jgi:hypothetical protein